MPIACTYLRLFRLQDWRSHKEYCLKVKAAGAHTFDAILFAANETKPRLVKIPWKMVINGNEDDPGSESYHSLDAVIWFKHPNTAARYLRFDQWGFDGPELGRGLCIMYDDNFVMNGLPLNRCIMDVTGGRAGQRWRGNILGLRMKGDSDNDNFYANVDIEEDLKPFVTYFEEYNK